MQKHLIRLSGLAFSIAALVIFSSSVSAQFGSLGDKLLKKTHVATLIDGKADHDLFTGRHLERPDEGRLYAAQPKRSLTTLQRTPNGGFVLQPGYYTLVDRATVYTPERMGPAVVTAISHAPPKGSAEDAVMSVVRNSVNHPQIPQHEVQLLLWAIVAHVQNSRTFLMT